MIYATEILDALPMKKSLSDADIDRAIKTTDYVVYDGRLTICVLTLQNGYLVTGESACVSKEKFNKDIGEKIAYENARDKVWQLLGYELRTKLMAH